MPVDRRDLRRQIFKLAAEQAGYFTAAQGIEIGYSYQAQAHHVRAGNWLRIDRGLFRLAEWIPGIHDDLVRWTLWSKRRAVVSHETALSVHGIGEFESARVHLTVPPSFTMRDEAVTLHYSELPNEDILTEVGFRVTTPARSIIDIASLSPDQDQLSRSIEEARQSGRLTVRGLRSRAEALDARAALNIERAIQQVERS
ncbi:MAG: type IV toxin-antitoxin system AbiEi family antitoxin domain-containing protein [Actinomycetota bacterium]